MVNLSGKLPSSGSARDGTSRSAAWDGAVILVWVVLLLSGLSALDVELAEQPAGHLGTAGLEPGRLQLEVTERVALEETRPFEELRAEGVRLAIDDFGTGYSSLLYLRHLDADVLKVDRYFVQEVEEDQRTSIILRSVLSIGSHLGLNVIAEGVETEEQRDHLVDLGYGYAQGYFFARPMSAGDFEDLLRQEEPSPGIFAGRRT